MCSRQFETRTDIGDQYQAELLRGSMVEGIAFIGLSLNVRTTVLREIRDTT